MSQYASIERRIARSMIEVKKVLGTERDPKSAAEVDHGYADKFQLAEFVTSTACAGHLLCLESLGLTAETLARIASIAPERTLTLALRSTETCAFVKETKREENSRAHQTEYTNTAGSSTTVTSKVVKTITEYFWDVGVAYEVFIYTGNDKDGADRVVLYSGERKTSVKTLSRAEPIPKRRLRDVAETDLSWLARRVQNLHIGFSIDRAHKDCHTPRRNQDIIGALSFQSALRQWCGAVAGYFLSDVFPLEKGHGMDVAAIRDDTAFVPVLPLLEVRAHSAEGDVVVQVSDLVAVALPSVPAGGTVMLAGDMNALLGGQKKSLEACLTRMATTLGKGKGLITPAEGRLIVVAQHMAEVCTAHHEAVDFIEHMLHRQLVQAIGKEVSSADFTAYMQFHMRKVMQEAYTPRLFSHAVRHGMHNPEGTVSIEQEVGGDMAEPVVMVGRKLAAREVVPMRFALNASSDVHFGGTRHVHSYVCHRFSTEAMPQLSLVGRARQFSGFVLMVGAIGGADLFLPQHAMIVQNKDDLKLPLLLEEIPTPKEFKDAIESLSPEQKRFAQAYRAMQLEATLFGVCVVQIKPQLEKVLNLPADSLTKEIRLTQDLLELFLEYQIPGDLLSYQPDSGVSEAASAKVEAVRAQVAAMKAMVQKVKEDALEEARLVREMEKQQREAEQRQREMEQHQRDKRRSSRGGSGAGLAMCKSAPMRKRMCKAPTGSVPDSAPMRKKMSVLTESTSRPKSETTTKPESKQEEPTEQREPDTTAHDAVGEYDISTLPQILEQRYTALDEDSCLRPTILKTGGAWRKTAQATLLSRAETTTLEKDAQKKEKNRAFDLLDALTRSGALSIEDAALHVVVAATHCFDKTLMDTLVQDSVNPIEKVERSALIAASAVHNLAVENLLKNDSAARIKEHSPKLFLE